MSSIPIAPPLLRSLRSFGSATVVPNTGSTARDHLANERTFLAWSRTGLGFVGLGVALETFSSQRNHPDQTPTLDHEAPLANASPLTLIYNHAVSTPDRLASATLIGIGGLFLGFGTVRYFSVLRLLTRGQFQPNTLGIGMMVASSSLITGAGLAVVLVPEGVWYRKYLQKGSPTK